MNTARMQLNNRSKLGILLSANPFAHSVHFTSTICRDSRPYLEPLKLKLNHWNTIFFLFTLDCHDIPKTLIMLTNPNPKLSTKIGTTWAIFGWYCRTLRIFNCIFKLRIFNCIFKLHPLTIRKYGLNPYIMDTFCDID